MESGHIASVFNAKMQPFSVEMLLPKAIYVPVGSSFDPGRFRLGVTPSFRSSR